MRIRIKYRIIGLQGQQEWGKLTASKVFMQLAVTIPFIMAGLDLEVFI